MASLIALITLWYTNQTAGKIAKEEEQKIKTWAQAIQEKAELVRFTSTLFDTISAQEKNRARLFGIAITNIFQAEPNSALFDYSFQVIQSNRSIPTILVGEDGSFKSQKNVVIGNLSSRQIDSFLRVEGSLQSLIEDEFNEYDPIVVEQFDVRDYVYYKDSKVFTQLKKNLNDLIESFISDVAVNSASVPVIMLGTEGDIEAYGNIDTTGLSDPQQLQALLDDMTQVITIDFGEGRQKQIHYKNTKLLNQLRMYPFIQLAIIAVFLIVAYLAFSSARKSEQNQVWVGMAKEAAHQLGTPISSLDSWIEYIRDTPEEDRQDDEILKEIAKDVERLSLVADRFSKIGSKPVLTETNVLEMLDNTIAYVKRRASEKVQFEVNIDPSITFKINPPLFDWVMENLLKNALDAMEGEGLIKVMAQNEGKHVVIEVTDSGKGIPKGDFSNVFQPGFSTKKRGWGLGLSLTKRIVENYHRGKIFVKTSTINQGTTFRITLPK